MAEGCRCDAAPAEVQSPDPAPREEAASQPRTGPQLRNLVVLDGMKESLGCCQTSHSTWQESRASRPPCRGRQGFLDASSVPGWMWRSPALFCKISQTVTMPFHMVIR